MGSIIDHIVEYSYIYLIVTIVVFLVVLYFAFKPKKIKPIEVTIDDVLDETKTEIEKVIEALEENKSERPMTSFEEEQEANAIISYQELVRAVNEKKALYEVKNDPTKEIQNLLGEVSLSEVENEQQNLEQEQPKFKNSDFISPIFGKEPNKTNDEFLKELKDFRNNL